MIRRRPRREICLRLDLLDGDRGAAGRLGREHVAAAPACRMRPPEPTIGGDGRRPAAVVPALAAAISPWMALPQAAAGAGGQRQGDDQRAVLPVVDQAGGDADDAERQHDRPVAGPGRLFFLFVLRLDRRRRPGDLARFQDPAEQAEEHEDAAGVRQASSSTGSMSGHHDHRQRQAKNCRPDAQAPHRRMVLLDLVVLASQRLPARRLRSSRRCVGTSQGQTSSWPAPRKAAPTIVITQ